MTGRRPGILSGSWRLGVASLARPYRYSPMAVIAGWLPRGLVSTEPLKETVRRACADDWAPHPNFWSMAVDYTSGRRVAFGRTGAPSARLPDAVAASCAIPGFYRAVEIDGRAYVDGGVYSSSNLDVLRDERLDVVLALNPMSSLHVGSPRSFGERVAIRLRHPAGPPSTWPDFRAAARDRGTNARLLGASGARPVRDTAQP